MMHRRSPEELQAMREESLARAQGGMTVGNYPAIFAGFREKGIADADIRPRENVFTFNAWKALKRHVRRGEHGVHVLTYVPIPDRKAAELGADEKTAEKVSLRPRTAVVFHVSQTDPDAPSSVLA